MFAEQCASLDVCEAAPGRRVPFAPHNFVYKKGFSSEQGERSETKRKRALEVRLRLKFAPLILKGNCINIQKCVFYLYDSYEIRRLFSCQCRKN